MDAKLIINGKEITLTAEQIEVLGIKEQEDNDFGRIKGQEYYYIMDNGVVDWHKEEFDKADKGLHLTGNYCKNKQIMRKRAKQEVLNRLLWRFSMENGWDDKFWEDAEIPKFEISKDTFLGDYVIYNYTSVKTTGTVYFVSEEIAQRAIDEIIIPFERGELEVCKIWEE